jgi:hypothetical protein
MEYLEGKTLEQCIGSKSAGWSQGCQRLEVEIAADGILTVERLFELANRAHFLYLAWNHPERVNCRNLSYRTAIQTA